MVGNPDPKPKVKVFDCTACGAAITVRNPNSLAAACSTCQAVIDVSNDRYRLLAASSTKRQEYPAAFELGARGKLFDRKWEVLGHMVRRDVASSYRWNEYLLFNPYYGYRWLVEDKGHWLFVTPTKEKAKVDNWGGTLDTATRIKFRGRQYKVYNRGRAEVDYVNGEFYWKVKVEDHVAMDDYIAPPYMVSREQDDKETVWVFSEYVERRVIEKAFKDSQLPWQSGVAPAQPSQPAKDATVIGPLWIAFMVLLTVIEVWHASTSLNKEEFYKSYNLETNKTVDNAITTPPFTLSGDLANVEVTLTGADADNSWIYVSGELVNDKTGETYPFERTVEYYHGYEGGESWSEGSRVTSFLISKVPGGSYYMNLDYSSGDYKYQKTDLSIKVVRGATMWSNYIWSMILLTIMPFWFGSRAYSFEVERWSNSDYSPYRSSE